MPTDEPEKPGIKKRLQQLARKIHDQHEEWELRRRGDLEKEARKHDEFLRRSRENAGKRVYR